jgi:ribosomal protein L7/L12
MKDARSSDLRIDEDFGNELRALVTAGHRVEAVKRYRERTATELIYAMNAVEALAREQGITQRESDSVEWDVISLLNQGQTLQAVKFYRDRKGCGLSEAKVAIQRIAKEHNISTSGKSGCLPFALSLIVLAACLLVTAI